MKIYLAGPEVFDKDAKILGEKKKEICKRYNCVGLYPMDPIDMKADPDPRSGTQILNHLMQHLYASDAMIANITPWRGLYADTGTVLEIGLGIALNKKIVAYTNDSRDIKTRIEAQHEILFDKLGVPRTRHDSFEIEDFGYSDNLMIDASLIEMGSCVIKNDAHIWDLTAFEESLIELLKMNNFNFST